MLEEISNTKSVAGTTLVDVRTPQEWERGVPDLSMLHNKNTLLQLSWRTLPAMEINPAFGKDFSARAAERETPLLFLCKAGGRSFEAACAMSAIGYTQCYNIIGGFEDEAGWKATPLPWRK